MPAKFAAALAALALAFGPVAASAQAPKAQVAPPVRKIIYVMEQIATPKPPEAILRQLPPLKTLDQVEALLKANAVAFSWRKAEVDAGTLPPALFQQIEALPPGEVFAIPAGETLVLSVIIARK